MPKRLPAVIALGLTCLSMTACANEADGKAAAAALAFFKATEAQCNDYAKAIGQPELDPSLFAAAKTEDVLSEFGKQFVQVVDGAGNLLYVNLDDERVQGGVRPDEIIPEPYLRSCPAGLYLGISYELEKQG